MLTNAWGRQTVEAAETLLIPLLQAFLWFDDGLQSYLQSRGWDKVTRPQSMIMAHVMIGVSRPSDIARNLGLSRQAIHTTIGQMIAMGMLELTPDTRDARMKLAIVSGKGRLMSDDAQTAVEAIISELRRRIGKDHVDDLISAFRADWGPAPTEWRDARPKAAPVKARPE